MSRTTDREAAIRRVLESRFSLSALEALKTDPLEWNSARNDMGRGIYDEALRESRRLEAVPDAQLDAELAEVAFNDARRRFD
jgi:hypothetical protein